MAKNRTMMAAPTKKRRGARLDDNMSVRVDIERTDLVRTALVLEWLTLAWVLIEAAVAIWAASQARSLSLMAFGADSANYFQKNGGLCVPRRSCSRGPLRGRSSPVFSFYPAQRLQNWPDPKNDADDGDECTTENLTVTLNGAQSDALQARSRIDA